MIKQVLARNVLVPTHSTPQLEHVLVTQSLNSRIQSLHVLILSLALRALGTMAQMYVTIAQTAIVPLATWLDTALCANLDTP